MSDPKGAGSSAELVAAVERLLQAVRRPAVIKLGGSALEEPAAAAACLRSIAVLHRLGLPAVVVHGGGKPIDRAMAAAGLTPRKVAGRRYTDAATLAIVVQVLGAINRHLLEQLRPLGVDAVGMEECQPFPLRGERLQVLDEQGEAVDLGWVGSVAAVDVAGLRQWWERRQLPVLPSLAGYAASPCGWLNVNADTAAAAVAGALQVPQAIFLTDTPGVLYDRRDPASRVSRLDPATARAWIAAGIIADGMVPKVEACFEALAAGAHAAVILDGRVSFSLIDYFLGEAFPGTVVGGGEAGGVTGSSGAAAAPARADAVRLVES